MGGNHFLGQRQHQAAIAGYTADNAMLVKEDLDLLEVNHWLLRPKSRELKSVTNPRRCVGCRRGRPGARKRCRERRCEHIRRRTSTRRLAGESGSGCEEQIIRNHRR